MYNEKVALINFIGKRKKKKIDRERDRQRQTETDRERRALKFDVPLTASLLSKNIEKSTRPNTVQPFMG